MLSASWAVWARSPAARVYYPDWEQGADSIVASMRSAAGRNPHDTGPHGSHWRAGLRSDEFRYRWSAHDVRFRRSGAKRIRHRDVGDLAFSYEGLELPDSGRCPRRSDAAACTAMTKAGKMRA
jgi:hypothetical protein